MEDILIDIPERDVIILNNGKNVERYTASWDSVDGDSSDYDYLTVNVDADNSGDQTVVYANGNKVFANTASGLIAVTSTIGVVFPTKINIKATYRPTTKPVVLRMVCNGNTKLYLIKSFFWENISTTVKACQLPIINSDGEFFIKVKSAETLSVTADDAESIINNTENENNDTSTSTASITVDGIVYIYGGSAYDFKIGESSDQEAQLLALCAPGNLYRYPTIGIDISSYIHSVPSQSDLASKILAQFSNDSKSVTAANFDADTGDISVMFDVLESDDTIENTSTEDLTSEDSVLFYLTDYSSYSKSSSVSESTLESAALAELAVMQKQLDSITETLSNAKFEQDSPISKSTINGLFND